MCTSSFVKAHSGHNQLPDMTDLYRYHGGEGPLGESDGLCLRQ